MKRTLFRLLTICFATLTLAILSGSTLAQAPPTEARYRVNWIAGTAETTRITPRDLVITTDEFGVPVSAFVVGYYYRTDRTVASGFVYDVLGTINPDATYADPDPNQPSPPQPNRFWDIEELVGPDPPVGAPAWWAATSDPISAFVSVFRGVNSDGLIAGYVRDPNNDQHAAYIDLNQNQLTLQLIPNPLPSSSSYHASEATESGDILIRAHNGIGNQSFVYRVDDGSMTPILDPATGEPLLDRGSWPNLSSARDFVGLRNEDAVVLRHSMLTGQSEDFPDLLSYVPDCNELGEFVSGLIVPRPRGRRYDVHAIRVGTNVTSDWVGPADTIGVAVNDYGDVLFEQYAGGQGTGPFSYYHEGLQQTIPLTDLIIDQSDPDRWFRDAGGYPPYRAMSNQDETGFGWVTTGVYPILLPDGSTRGMLALLTPELPTPTPGVTVTPTTGLVTTEAGGTDSFDVVLATQPTADVTIGISSADASEGTVDVSSLTFTAANWNLPQTLTVTGVDDAIEDGDFAYSIVTAAATSTDPDYDGLNADDVAVTNLDNEGPLVYSSDDTPLAIPDNDPAGVSSNILVTDDFQIAGLTVTLDINHQRPSDLTVWLIGPSPNNLTVQLTNFGGANYVLPPAFNGTSTFGLWTLQVIDNRNKKTGTLNSWSIAVEPD